MEAEAFREGDLRDRKDPCLRLVFVLLFGECCESVGHDDDAAEPQASETGLEKQ